VCEIYLIPERELDLGNKHRVASVGECKLQGLKFRVKKELSFAQYLCMLKVRTSLSSLTVHHSIIENQDLCSHFVETFAHQEIQSN